MFNYIYIHMSLNVYSINVYVYTFEVFSSYKHQRIIDRLIIMPS